MKDWSKVGLKGIKLILEFRHYKLMKATSSVRDKFQGVPAQVCVKLPRVYTVEFSQILELSISISCHSDPKSLREVTYAPLWAPQPPQEGIACCEKQYCRLVLLHSPLRPVARLPCVWEGWWLSTADHGISSSQSASIYTLHPSPSV